MDFGVEQLLDVLARAEEQRLGVVGLDAEQLCNLGVRPPVDDMQLEHGALPLGYLLDNLQQLILRELRAYRQLFRFAVVFFIDYRVLHNRNGILLFPQMLDGLVHRNAHQPCLETPCGAVGVGVLDGLQERLMRQILGRLPVVHIPVAHSNHLLNVLGVLPFPKLCLVHVQIVLY